MLLNDVAEAVIIDHDGHAETEIDGDTVSGGENLCTAD